jgi:hypothetical protein
LEFENAERGTTGEFSTFGIKLFYYYFLAKKGPSEIQIWILDFRPLKFNFWPKSDNPNSTFRKKLELEFGMRTGRSARKRPSEGGRRNGESDREREGAVGSKQTKYNIHFISI